MLLLSKCVAGGFSAAVILLWWPLIAPGDSLSAWLGRGVAFTLSFELLLLGLRPLEHALWATRTGNRLRIRVEALGERVSRGDTVRRLGSTAALAAAVVAIPVTLIAAGLHERPAETAERKASPVRVVRVTKIVRPVTVRRVVAANEAPAAPAVAAKATPVAQPKALPPRPAADKARPVEKQTSNDEAKQSPVEEPATPDTKSGEDEAMGETQSLTPSA